MTKHFKAIHQFHSGTAPGDAVTQQMLFLRSQLRAMGYDSEIYAQHIAKELIFDIRDIASYAGAASELLLVHHSMGHTSFDHVVGLPSPIVTVFHSITPAKFFDDPYLRNFVRLGIEQLRVLAKRSLFGIADSNHNRKEMYDAGFRSVSVIPVRIDFSAPRSARSSPDARSHDWLFVGRLAPNKCQLDVVRAFAAYNRSLDKHSHLTFVGDLGLVDYVEEVTQEARRLGVDSHISLTGKVSDAELWNHYGRAGLFVCMSQHEGFGVPLLEAMAAGLPVIARAEAAVPETMGGAGLLVSDSDPWTIAALAHTLTTDDDLRHRLVKHQDQRIQRIEQFDVERALRELVAEAADGARPTTVQIQGPFETSYSLAVLNRELAEGLSTVGDLDVSIYATEGPGDYEPRADDLARHPIAAALHQASPLVPFPDRVIRQMYPPRVDDSTGGMTFQYFGWEESLLPSEYVVDFNRYLDGMGVMSQFVEKVLRDSGVSVPIAVVGVGVTAPNPEAVVEAEELEGLRGFRFLHNSSAFPRKGVDLILEAFFRSFTADDDVSLILKTYPNPHNEVGELLSTLKSAHANPPDVRWIDRDLDRTEIDGLYNLASSYVHPARGEGFGLPVAEAMLAGVPVISVAATGLAEFVSEETAALVPYRVAPAATHLSVSGSEWVEPDIDALISAMVGAFRGDDDGQRQERVQNARALIESRFSWTSVCSRWADFLRQQSERRRGIKVAMVTTWNSRCGIADYSRSLAESLGSQIDLEPYADKAVVPLTFIDEEIVVRAWDHGIVESIDPLLGALDQSTADVVHIQYNWGFFSLGELGRLIDHEVPQRPVVVTLHRTTDQEFDGETFSLRSIVPSLMRATTVIVHQGMDVALLRDLGVVDNVHCIPIGCAPPRALDRAAARQLHQADPDTFLIGTFGFLLAHKGTLELIRALRLLRDDGLDVQLIAVCAIHPDPSSNSYRSECAAEIRKLGLEDRVTLATDYLPDQTAMELLSMTDVIALPYAQTNESSSAALRFVLPIGRPVIVTDLPIFDDARDVLEHVPAPVDINELAAKIRSLMNDPARRDRLAEAARRFCRQNSWASVARSTLSVYQEAVGRDQVST